MKTALLPTYTKESDFAALPKELHDMFIKTFENGYQDSECRTTAAEWMEVLKKFISPSNFRVCEKGHCYFNTVFQINSATLGFNNLSNISGIYSSENVVDDRKKISKIVLNRAAMILIVIAICFLVLLVFDNGYFLDRIY